MLATALLLTSCAGTGGAVCDVLRPIYVADDDVLTDGTARQVLANNRTWDELCR